MTESDHVRIMCPSLGCRRVLAVPSSSRGKNVRCKNCGTMIRVPQRSSSNAPAAQPASDAAPGGAAGAQAAQPPAQAKPAA